MSEAATLDSVEAVVALESAGDASLPASKQSLHTQQVEQRHKKKGMRVSCPNFFCCTAPKCKESSSPAAVATAAPCTAHSCVCEQPCVGPQSCPGSTAAAKPRHSNPFASPLQQQQSGEVLQAMQSCKSGQLQPGASQQLSGILSEDWFETRSMFSEAFSLEQQLSEQLLAAQQQASMPVPAPALQLQQAGPWVPETPLLFAEPGLRFIPVPAVTGFAGFWEVDSKRSTPHPQPIDIMNNVSFIVKKVHQSIHAMVLGESEGQLTLAARPGFLPPGLPASYCEVYDKTNKTDSTWTPRRDMRLGSCAGKLYMTDSDMLILRVEARPPFHRGRIDTISEAYITKEEGGQVLVSRMCCMDLATGKRATQLQVARLRRGST
uniref:Uncharacterized protein n=1 Tax=Tetradesmus obliquus TaxID=3088 RepID=A0A383W3W6_TETOB|eukprot:jgi/Sobl393_1/2590/SZX72335.1